MFVLVTTAVTIAVVIGESAIRSGIPATEPFAIVAGAKAEAGMAERIEPAMIKGVFPAPYQPVTITTAFFKSLPTAVLPVIVISAIVLPTVVIMVIVFPAVTVTVFVMPIIAVTAIILSIIAISTIVLPAVTITVAPSYILSEGA